jgi:hypothetical protein
LICMQKCLICKQAGALGGQRIRRARQDIAHFVTNADEGNAIVRQDR